MTEPTPDFGYTAPKRTKKECPNPAFADHHLHRVGVFKRQHLGSLGDIDEGGLPGWTSQLKCVQCGRKFKGGYFHPDGLEEA